MCRIAIMHLIGDLVNGKLIVHEQFLYPLDLVRNKELFDAVTLHFREDICQIGIVVI